MTDSLDDERTLWYVQRAHIQQVLRQTWGNKKEAAKILGISRRALYRRLERYKMDDDWIQRRPDPPPSHYEITTEAPAADKEDDITKKP
jgi:hypothetical protein